MKPVDYIAIILSIAVFIAIVAPAIRGIVYGIPLSDQAAEIVADVLKVTLGAIIAYLGHKMSK